MRARPCCRGAGPWTPPGSQRPVRAQASAPRRPHHRHRAEPRSGSRSLGRGTMGRRSGSPHRRPPDHRRSATGPCDPEDTVQGNGTPAALVVPRSRSTAWSIAVSVLLAAEQHPEFLPFAPWTRGLGALRAGATCHTPGARNVTEGCPRCHEWVAGSLVDSERAPEARSTDHMRSTDRRDARLGDDAGAQRCDHVHVRADAASAHTQTRTASTHTEDESS